MRLSEGFPRQVRRCPTPFRPSGFPLTTREPPRVPPPVSRARDPEATIRKALPMTRHRWRTELKSCTCEVDVLKVVERFLGEWSAGELRELPVAPGTFTSARAVSEFTFRLGHAHARYDGSNQSLLLLQEMLLFFTQASVRV